MTGRETEAEWRRSDPQLLVVGSRSLHTCLLGIPGVTPRVWPLPASEMEGPVREARRSGAPVCLMDTGRAWGSWAG